MTEEQKREVERARAYGLMRGACEALLLRLPKDERQTVEALTREADALWDGAKVEQQEEKR